MRSIIDRIRSNSIDYNSIVERSDMWSNSSFINIVVGARNRTRFVKPLFDSLNKARLNLDVSITLVEHSERAQHVDACLQNDVNYIHIKDDGPYNRSLAFNVGVLFGPKSDWIVTHDLDCLVKQDFFVDLIREINTNKNEAFQSFRKRRVIYCDEGLTEKILRKEKDIEDVHEGAEGTFTCVGEAPGGSMFVSRRIFFHVGGYDPELFTGYAPEDQMFWNKLSMFTDIRSCDNIDIFHLHHPFMGKTNPNLMEMIKISKHFQSLPMEEKINIVSFKRKLIQQWE